MKLAKYQDISIVTKRQFIESTEAAGGGIQWSILRQPRHLP